MAIEFNRTHLISEATAAAKGFTGNAAAPLPVVGQAAVAPAVLPREVVRCQQCQLIQFRTQSDLCRRCAKPLPVLLKFVEPQEMEPEQSAAEPAAPPIDMSLDRAGRNRQVSIGGKMKAIREERLLTQVEMAALLEIPRSYLSRIENSRLLPGPLMVARFAASLGVGIGELVGCERRRDGARLFPADPSAATLYSQFARLRPEQMEMVLGAARAMVKGSFNPLPAADKPPAPPQPPALQGMRQVPAPAMPPSMTMPMPTPMSRPMSRPEGARRLAIVPNPRHSAR